MIRQIFSVSMLGMAFLLSIEFPVEAKPKTYQCESYKTIDGKWRHRISPPLPGSFGSTSGFGKVGMDCLFPVSSKKCKYNDGNGWHNCGYCPPTPGQMFTFCLDGYGEIVEIPGQGRYRVIRNGTRITLQ